MTGDPEADAAAARAAVKTIAEFIEAQLGAGANPAILGTAALGMATDLLAKAIGKEKTAMALRLLADELPTIRESQ